MKLQVRFYSDRPIENYDGYFYSVTRGVGRHWEMVDQGDNFITIQTRQSRELNPNQSPVQTFNDITPELFESSHVYVTV